MGWVGSQNGGSSLEKAEGFQGNKPGKCPKEQGQYTASQGLGKQPPSMVPGGVNRHEEKGRGGAPQSRKWE